MTARAAAWARSGVVALTGRPGKPPLVPPGSAALRAAGLAELLAESTARTGRPVRVDGPRLLSERAAYTRRSRQGAVSLGGSCRLLPTADGWAAVSCARPDDPDLLAALAFAGPGEEPWPALGRWLAAHSGDELAERAALLGVAAGPVRRPPRPAVPAPAEPRPLEGALVVDFSALWAGPLCAHLLGLAGARVVKVETPARPDGARRGNRDFYDLLHSGHRSVVLDPDTPSGRRALARLVDAADIVIEASRPRALARWGLDAGEAVEAGKTWVSITSHGRGADRVGFGDDVAACAGLIAWDGEGPVFCGDALADPLTGLTAAVLAATAPPGGRGVLWEVAMADVVATTLPEDPPGPCQAARPGPGGWSVDTAQGPVPVAVPERRTGSVPPAPESGADTEDVLQGLGIPLP
ncbi:CoA transferase [Actinocorallia populi]|uniref:CoA transferase n=1 Tax=Actinocorallia populi TaxID=2079200 RepID=UPI000D08FDF1|nr:CoA transferase [Actinocorallia populi]